MKEKLWVVLFLLIITIGSSDAFSKETIQSLTEQWNNLKPYQKATAQNIYNRASKDDIGYTAAAIAWKETLFGTMQININRNGSWDCGLFGNNTKTVLSHRGIPNTHYNKKILCTDLVRDPAFSYQYMHTEIMFWNNVHKGNKFKWLDIWASYNGGYKGNYKYANSIALRIQVLKHELDIK